MIVINFEFAEDGTCTHVRGDTAQFEMEVQVDGAVIPQWQGVFSVKQYLDDDSYLYQVQFNHNVFTILCEKLLLETGVEISFKCSVTCLIAF